MANRAYLYATPTSGPVNPAEHEPLLAANYQTPICWLSGFDESDIVFREVAMCDAEGNPTEPDRIPFLVASRDFALTRSMEREPIIFQIVPGELRPHHQEWIGFLQGLPECYIQLDLSELWAMVDPERFSDSLRNDLRAFQESRREAWSELLEQATISADDGSYDPAMVPYGMRGYPWSAKLAWS
jgi:hypothetical protein